MKTAEFRFGLSGLISKEDPTLLKDGQYRSVVNCEVIQEGGIASKNGRKLLGTVNAGGGVASAAYRIQKLVTSPTEDPRTPSTNLRYIGVSDNSGVNLWRTPDYNSFTNVASSINSTAGICRKRFQLAAYVAGSTGNPWAFIAAENAMLKDNGLSPYGTLHRWGILPAAGVATSVTAGAGNLNGGDAASPAGSTSYDWRYTLVATDTNNEGNPSQTMLADSVAGAARVGGSAAGTNSGTPMSCLNESVTVTGYGSGDAQIGFVNVYRRGGILFDAWRLVQQVANPGAGATWNITDNVADADLVSAPLLSIYNDPPVPSTPPKPITGSLAVIAAAGRQVVNLTVGTLAGVTAGTTLHLFYDSPEDVIIESIASNTQFTAYFQHTHLANADFEIDVICAQPCCCAVTYQQFVLVAGDPNNPHLIYRCLGGMPESFPPVPADQTTAIAACGSPSNPILAMTTFRGEIVTLNAESIFVTLIINGNLLQGSEQAKKGLVAPFAWCQTETEIWFLSTDGVYSWDGSSCRKRSIAIDNIFHNQQVNNIPPISIPGIISTVFTSNQPPSMDYYRGQIRLLYLDNSGNYKVIFCDPNFGDRWNLLQYPLSGKVQVTYTEEDTGSNIQSMWPSGGGARFCIEDQQTIAAGVNYTTDLFTSDPTAQGTAIGFDIRTPWVDFGDPFSQKDLSEALLDLDASGSVVSGAVALAVDILVDYADSGTLFLTDASAVDTLTIDLSTPPSRSSPISLLPALESVGGHIQALGRKARAFSFHIYGFAAPTRMSFYRLFFRYEERAQLTAGGPTDWTNLGVKTDKKLYQMTVEYDVAGVGQTLALDIVYGPGAGAYLPAAQTFTLNNPVLSDSSPGKATEVFPISPSLNGANSVVKQVRLRPYSTASAVGKASAILFQIFGVDFIKEEYPPDIVAITPWEDGGYEYDKYANQIDLEVNTNNAVVTVNLQADGQNVLVGGVPWFFLIQTTEGDRRRNITIPPGLVGKKWRIFVDPTQATLWTGGGTGMFQLFSHRFSFQPADLGDVIHSGDWDSLEHSFDKYLQTVTVEWDLSLAPANTTVTLQLDLKNGIGGGTLVSNVGQFILTGARSKATFPIAINTIAKLVRLYPITSPLPVGFKQWKYRFNFIPYPADTILSTEWKDASSPDAKNPSWLYIDADTQSVPCALTLQNEIGTAITATHTGTQTNRKANYPIPADIFAKMWRVLAAPGGGGKYQQFDWGFARWSPFPENGPVDPPEVVLWTPWWDGGYPYEKIARALNLTVNTNGVSVPIVLESDTGASVEFVISTTYTTRHVVLSCPSNLLGRSWRIILPSAPFGAGKFQLWNWDLDAVKEPAALTVWDSYETTLGSKFYKFLKQGWWMYTCGSQVTLFITSDTGVFTVTLPAHATRSEERFLFPTVFGSGLNKSKVFRIALSAATPFKFYAEGSGLEFIVCGADRHAGYQQATCSEIMQPVG